MIVVRCTRTVKRTAVTTDEVRYYLSSAEPTTHTPTQWLELIQGHWAGVEIRNRWSRDAIWGEDRSRTRNPNALANPALVRSALLALLPDHTSRTSPCRKSRSASTPGPPHAFSCSGKNEVKIKDLGSRSPGLRPALDRFVNHVSPR